MRQLQVRSAELRLGVSLPEDHREFLRTCDGLPADVVFPRLLGTAELRGAVRGANAQLCLEIRKGSFDEAGAFLSLLRGLRRWVVRKLEVANPRHLAALRAEKAGGPGSEPGA